MQGADKLGIECGFQAVIATAFTQSHGRSISENGAELRNALEPPVRLRGIIAEQGCLFGNCKSSGDGGLRRWSSITCEFVSAWPYQAAGGSPALLRTPSGRISRVVRRRRASGELSAAVRGDCHRPSRRNELKSRCADGQLPERKRCQLEWP